MKIRNNRQSACFFPYAGTGRRGVQLAAGAVSPELPATKLLVPRLQRDLKNGVITILATTSEKTALRGMVGEDILGLLGVDTGKATPAPAPAPAPAAPAPAAEKKDDGPDLVVEPAVEPVKVDPVKDAIMAELKTVKDPADLLRRMSNRRGKKNEGIRKAAKELLDNEDFMQSITRVEPDVEEPEEPQLPNGPCPSSPEDELVDKPIVPDAGPCEEAPPEEEPVVEEAPDVVVEPPVEDEPAEETKVQDEPEPSVEDYKGGEWAGNKGKSNLLAEAVRRGLDATPSMTSSKLRKMLVEDDKNKSE